MNELALFAGAGGGILGGKLLGWRTVCAVEWEPYPASVLCARQNDGLLETFPIWDDVQTFDGHPWRGIVDVVSGGFPCQDISAAGGGEALMAKDQECGEKWRGSFTKYSLDSFSWKTHQCSLLGGLEEFLETWPKWGLMQNGECWEAKMLGPFIEETEFGLSLPTIVKSDSNATSKNRFLNSRHFRGAKMSEGLRICETDPTSVHPSFGEKTMGWPTMWTGLAPLAMDKFQEWQQQHGGF